MHCASLLDPNAALPLNAATNITSLRRSTGNVFNTVTNRPWQFDRINLRGVCMNQPRSQGAIAILNNYSLISIRNADTIQKINTNKNKIQSVHSLFEWPYWTG